MLSELIKYKHYLLVIFAIVAFKWLYVPAKAFMYESQSEYFQLTKRLNKVESLISTKEELVTNEQLQLIEVNKANAYLFKHDNEASLKLAVQAKIEQLIKKAGCELEQLAWKGSVDIGVNLVRWQLDTRFKGKTPCLIKASRNIEALTPSVNIQRYSYGGKQISDKAVTPVTATLELTVIQYLGEAL